MPDVQSETGQAVPVEPPPASGSDSAIEALAHLHKMSGTGSAFGTTDYVAINPTAIASLALALASALALALPLLVILPLAGIVCALLALRQIRNSNGTQTGRGFAAAGLVLSLLLGGSVIAKEALKWSAVRADTNACAAVIDQLGQKLHADRYDEIYQDLTTSRFRAHPKMSQALFSATLANFRYLPAPHQPKPADPRYGHVDSVTWNGEPMEFQDVADTGVRLAYAMAMVHFHGVEEPSRQFLRFSNRDGQWKLDAWERLFPEKPPRSSTVR